MPDIEALLTQALATPVPGPKCWRPRISGELLEFVEALEPKLHIPTANFQHVSRIMRSQWPEAPSGDSLRRHYRARSCSCYR